MTVYKIQPAPHTDHILGDGTELTKLPYPVFANERGDIVHDNVPFVKVIGFARDLSAQRIDLWWADAVAAGDLALKQAVGMYLVVSNAPDHMWSSLVTAVESIEEVQS